MSAAPPTTCSTGCRLTAWPRRKHSSPSQLYITPTSSTWSLILNTRTAPFTDLRVRQAINYAVDRAKIAALLGGSSQPACQILPVGLPGYRRYCPYTIDPNPAGIWHAPNLAQAEHLIAASHTGGTPITIWNLGRARPRTGRSLPGLTP